MCCAFQGYFRPSSIGYLLSASASAMMNDTASASASATMSATPSATPSATATMSASPSAAATTLPRTGGPGGPPLNLLFTLVATLTLVGAGLFALFLVRRSVEPLVRDVRKYLHRVGKG